MLEPKVITSTVSLDWWHKDIKELYNSTFREQKYKRFFMPLTSEQSRLAWQKLEGAIDDADPRGLKPIVMSGMSALIYFYGTDKRNELKTSKDRDKYADELRNMFNKVSKDLLSLNRKYEQNIWYFEDHNCNLAGLSLEVARISETIKPVELDPMLSGKKTRLGGAVFLARNLEKVIRDLTGNPHYKAISGLISAVFDDPDGDFSPEKIRDWCRSGKNHT